MNNDTLIDEILGDKELKDLNIIHASNIIEFLYENEVPFLLRSISEFVKFNPPLPDKINNSFKDIILFDISEATLDSIDIDKEILYFDTAFKDNEDIIITTVSIPLERILEIIYKNMFSIYINNLALIVPQEEDISGLEHSKNMFLNNPENKKFQK